MDRFNNRLIAALVSASLGCSNPAAPDVSLGGAYVLFQYNSAPVPLDLFPLPDRNGRPTSCRYTLSEGSLHLRPVDSSYSYRLIYRASCDQRVLYDGTVSGRFVHAHGAITFRTPGQNGERLFVGSFDADKVVIVPEGTVSLSFVKVR